MPSPDDPFAVSPPLRREGGPEPSGNGHVDDPHGTVPAPPTQREPPGPSTRFALVALGLAFLLATTGVLASALAGGGGGAGSAPSPTTTPSLAGSPLPALAAGALLTPIEVGGQPPADILGALSLPAGTVVTSGSATDRGVESYDRSLGFTVPAPEQAVISFFRVQLPAAGWHVLSAGAVSGSPGAFQILARRASVAGEYWEVGATIAPTTFAAGSQTQATPFTLRLFVVSDAG